MVLDNITQRYLYNKGKKIRQARQRILNSNTTIPK